MKNFLLPALFIFLNCITQGQTTSPNQSIENIQPPAFDGEINLPKPDFFAARKKGDVPTFGKFDGKTENSAARENQNETGDAPTDWKLKRGEKQINIEFGYSPFQPTFFAEKEYDTSGRSFGIVSARWGRVIGTAKNITFEYQIEAVPLFVALKNEVVNPAYKSAAATPNEPPTIRETTTGFGFLPLGFRFLFLPRHRLKPFYAMHTGFACFSKKLPTPESLRFNFTGDVGGGLQYQMTRKTAVSFGYRYYHISNINLGEKNPGYNANVFYTGFSFFYK